MKAIKSILGLGFALLVDVGSIAQESIQSNANDAFVTKPGKSKKIDLGATIEVDAKGYPTQESVQTIYDEMDYQRAVSAYLQTIPQMALYGPTDTYFDRSWPMYDIELVK